MYGYTHTDIYVHTHIYVMLEEKKFVLFLKKSLWKFTRVTTGISAFLLGWPLEAQSSPRVAREIWGLLSSHCRAYPEPSCPRVLMDDGTETVVGVSTSSSSPDFALIL